MFIRCTLPALFVIAVASSGVGQEKTLAKYDGKNAGFERLKSLAGDWFGKETGKDIHVRYKVTAAGSAVVETIMPDTPHEMVSVIHPDGDSAMLLTHYCMLGNQPQMKAAWNGAGEKVDFKFVRITNLKSEKDMHMHDVSFTLVDTDTLRTEWTHFGDGKAMGTVVFDLKRKK